VNASTLHVGPCVPVTACWHLVYVTLVRLCRYAFNDVQLFKGLRHTASIVGPAALNATLGGKTLLQWLDYLATSWQRLGRNATAGVGPLSNAGATEGSFYSQQTACNLTGGWLGYWVTGHRWSPGLATLTEDRSGALLATYTGGTGWDHGNGTVDATTGLVTLSVYLGTTLHAVLTGRLGANCSTVVWDNDSAWCRAGTSNCSGPTPSPPPTPPVPGALTDYGGASNLLECVPTYIHKGVSCACVPACRCW